MTEPTDAELNELADACTPNTETGSLNYRKFARAVLAKWGAQPAACEPMTDEQIEALPLWKRFVGLWPETRREIVRTIERHHGIKGGQHGTE